MYIIRYRSYKTSLSI